MMTINFIGGRHTWLRTVCGWRLLIFTELKSLMQTYILIVVQGRIINITQHKLVRNFISLGKCWMYISTELCCEYAYYTNKSTKEAARPQRIKSIMSCAMLHDNEYIYFSQLFEFAVWCKFNRSYNIKTYSFHCT